jgi:hypothetical protein
MEGQRDRLKAEGNVGVDVRYGTVVNLINLCSE